MHKELQEFAVDVRRKFHIFPEVGFTEFITTYEIYQLLQSLSFDLYIGREILESDERYGVPTAGEIEASKERAIAYGVPEAFAEKLDGGHTGVVAVLDTGRKGPHIAMRYDIDGLPITESDEKGHVPFDKGFLSQHPKEMHACGHDGHISIGLAVAKYLDAHKDELTGKFTIIFQPAEEGLRGANSIVQKGWLDKVDYFMSGHLGINSLQAGSIAATADQLLASTKFDVTFTGKSAHAGVEPNEGKNALTAAATALLQLNAIPRHRDGTTRINVGRLSGGSGRNVIADEAVMLVETRGETTELNQYMYDEAVRIIQAAAAMHDVKASIRFMGQGLGSKCDAEWIQIVKDACEKNLDVKEIYDVLPLKASEDASYMIDHVQKNGGLATYMVFPSLLPAGHHHPNFDIDEDAVRTAVSVYIDIINYLQHK
ncbi:amidohydrolase [Oceanobacillus sojae]|uniref:Aminobenzoyl-glutamate utilization protein A n=1 Tax=Oceanobacillus sojae TaxID=582851 RepID=A0A511ZFH3_9BACI|nr:amidohydrolase [Oceanobacillus sojae]GEN86194.1 aminobenzoyl-glutamate utilization protein A [Oceanobacillus sojae]